MKLNLLQLFQDKNEGTRVKPQYRVNDVLMDIGIQNVQKVMDGSPTNHYLLEVYSSDGKTWTAIGVFTSPVTLIHAMQEFERKYLGCEIKGECVDVIDKISSINF